MEYEAVMEPIGLMLLIITLFCVALFTWLARVRRNWFYIDDLQEDTERAKRSQWGQMMPLVDPKTNQLATYFKPNRRAVWQGLMLGIIDLEKEDKKME